MDITFKFKFSHGADWTRAFPFVPQSSWERKEDHTVAQHFLQVYMNTFPKGSLNRRRSRSTWWLIRLIWSPRPSCARVIDRDRKEEWRQALSILFCLKFGNCLWNFFVLIASRSLLLQWVLWLLFQIRISDSIINQLNVWLGSPQADSEYAVSQWANSFMFIDEYESWPESPSHLIIRFIV